uniref:DUF2304 domain-containing protein n=1 Tax=Paenibacillus sp. FSL M7-0896 TaxID=2921610 RepID=UPI00403EC1AB
MFPLKLQLSLIILCIILLFFLINMIKKYQLQLRYALLWIIVVIIMITISILPQIAFFFTSLFGFQAPSNFVFLVGIICGLVIIFSLSISISNLSIKVRQMSQEIGLLKQSLEIDEANRREVKEYMLLIEKKDER